jgi:hydroxypyruvate isomerase
MLRFAANLQWLFTEHVFLDRFEAAAQAGFRAVEFPSPYEHPAADIRWRLMENSLECVLFNLPSGDRNRGDFGIACRPERESEFRAGVGRAIGYARTLGVSQVNCVSGRIGPGEDREALMRTLTGNLRYAAREFRAAGLDLLVEPINTHDVPGFLVPTSTEAARLIEEIDEPNLFLQFDLYHTAMMGDDGAALLESLKPLIRHIQFADAPGRGEPGTGKVDIADLFKRIDASGYAGWVSAEYRPSARTEETLAWLSLSD